MRNCLVPSGVCVCVSAWMYDHGKVSGSWCSTVSALFGNKLEMIGQTFKFTENSVGTIY